MNTQGCLSTLRRISRSKQFEICLARTAAFQSRQPVSEPGLDFIRTISRESAEALRVPQFRGSFANKIDRAERLFRAVFVIDGKLFSGLDGYQQGFLRVFI